MVKNILKTFLLEFYFFLIKPFTFIANSQKINKVIILTIHDVPRNSYENLRSTLYEINSKYGFMHPDEFEDFTKGKSTFGLKYLLTFDDGLISNYFFAKEILDELSIKAIFFVPVNFINMNCKAEQQKFVLNSLCNSDENSIYYKSIHMRQSMSWRQLRKLLNWGHTIGSHTMSHVNLKKIEKNSILKCELIDSLKILEDKLSVKIKHFAFPTGQLDSVSQISYDLAKDNYDYVFSNLRGINSAKNKIFWRDDINAFDIPRKNFQISIGALHIMYFFERLKMKYLLKV